MKIKIVIPYFGRFPNYFEFFLKSCEANDEIKFLVFTDQSVFPEHPSNVSFHVMSFDAFKGIVQKNLSLSSQCVQVLTPYKLCDYRPAYGLIFAEYLKDADFWGFCDVDLIFGKIFDLLSLEKIAQSERILTQGHLTMYKNRGRMKRRCEIPVPGGIGFRQAITIPEPCFFDEIFMPAICQKEGVVQYGENIFADILPQYGDFVIAPLCAIKNKQGQTFYWESGTLYRVYNKGTKAVREELMYIHLQKRPMPPYTVSPGYSGAIYITPQGFFTQQQYTPDCEQPNTQQKKQYQKKRWAALTPRKIWIKLKVRRFKEHL